MEPTGIRKLFRNSAIYGIGDVVNRAGAMLLLPLYTRHLSPEQYGTIELFYAFSGVIRVFLGVGLGHATLRFYFEYKDPSDKNKVISTAILSSLLISTGALVLLSPFCGYFSERMFSTREYVDLFYIVFATIVFSLLSEIILAYIRAREKAVRYVMISAMELVLKIVVSIALVVRYRMGVTGVLLGNLASLAIPCIVVGIPILVECGVTIHRNILRALLKYSYPLVLVSLCNIVVSYSDRFFIQKYVSLGAVGLYALASKFGQLVDYLFTQPFAKGYGPYRFDVMHREDASEIYSRIMLYFSLGVATVWLCVSMFAGDVIRIMSSKEYYNSANIVPVLAIVSCFSGYYYIVQTGIYVKKATNCLPKIFLIVGLLNVLFNFVFVRALGVMGAAVSQVATQAAIVLLTHMQSQKELPIRYPLRPMLGLWTAAFITYGVSTTLSGMTVPVSVGLKTVLAILFLATVWNARILEDGDKEAIIGAYRKLVHRSQALEQQSR